MVRETAKYSKIKYQEAYWKQLVAVETSGVWCDEGQEWIYAIGKKIIEKSGHNKARSHLIQ